MKHRAAAFAALVALLGAGALAQAIRLRAGGLNPHVVAVLEPARQIEPDATPVPERRSDAASAATSTRTEPILRPPAEAGIRPARSRHSPYREFAPFEAIDLAVGLDDAQRPRVRALVEEREQLMADAMTRSLIGEIDAAAGDRDIRAIHAHFHERIRLELRGDQQAALDAALRSGALGPIFVMEVGSRD